MKIFNGVRRKFHGSMGYDLVPNIKLDEKDEVNSEATNASNAEDRVPLIVESEWQEGGLATGTFGFLEELEHHEDSEPEPTSIRPNDAKKRGGFHGPVAGFVCVQLELGGFMGTAAAAGLTDYESESLALLKAIRAMEETRRRTTLAELFSQQNVNGEFTIRSRGKKGGGADAGVMKPADPKGVDQLELINPRLISKTLQSKIYPKTGNNNNLNLNDTTKANHDIYLNDGMINNDEFDRKVGGEKISMLKSSSQVSKGSWVSKISII